MAKARFEVLVDGVVLAQNDRVSIDGKEYCYRGCKDGKTIALTVSGHSNEWVHMDSKDLGVEVRSKTVEAKTMAKTKTVSKKTTSKTAKAPAKKQEVSKRQGYTKQRAADMQSEHIRELSQGCVCSYNMWYMHLTDNKDGSILATGTTRSGKKRHSIYKDAVVTKTDWGCYVICHNSSGALCTWIHDNGTGETCLVVDKLPEAKEADLF